MSTKIQEAIAAIKSGDKETGKRLLNEILKADPQNENAWLWMTQVVSSNDVRMKCLQNVLKINPSNEIAKRGLATLERKKQTRQCPYCAETIKAEAKICRFCGRDLSTGRPQVMQSSPQRLWSPGIAAVLSLVIPGAGQMYKGQIGRGILHLIIIVIGYSLFIIPGLILHILCIIDASQGNPYKE